MDSLLHRLKQRKIVQWALAYLAAAFVVFQAMDALSEPLGLSLFAQRAIVALVILGFLCTLVVAWYHGEQGRQRVSLAELVILTLLIGGTGATIAVMQRAEATVSGTSSRGAPAASAPVAAVGADPPIVAVLPLGNLSGEAENAHLAASSHEELLRLLSTVRDLGVVSRTSVLRYADTDRSIPELGGELGADYIVQGSLQERRGRVRIQVQLIDAATDQQLWAERYDRDQDDVFAMLAAVAQALAAQLSVALNPSERSLVETPPTLDPIAYDLYLRAIELDPSDAAAYESAVGLLRRATVLDPGFAQGHSSLALVFREGSVVHGLVPFDSAVARADLAVELAPENPRTLRNQAWILADSGQPDSARVVLQRLVAQNPNHADAWGLLAELGWRSGDNVGGALAGRRSAVLDPQNLFGSVNVGYSLMSAGMYDEATRWMNRVLAFDPEMIGAKNVLALAALGAGDDDALRASLSHAARGGSPFELFDAAMLRVALGDLEGAEDALEELTETNPALAYGPWPSTSVMLGWIRHHRGDPGAGEALEQLRSHRLGEGPGLHPADHVLLAAALEGEDELLRAFLDGSPSGWVAPWYLWATTSPAFEPIRHRPEFQSWIAATERDMAAQRRELDVMGPWIPDEVFAASPPSPR
jgi:TolB-like protein/cytochrome c-type biogenesis protein CcmH/NrfG